MNNHTSSCSSPVRGLRGLFRSLACATVALAAGFLSDLSAAPVHEVLVCARVTAAGRKLPAPTSECPATYVLAATAARDLGAPLRERQTADVQSVARDVRRALLTNDFRGVEGERVPAGSLIVVFHWGTVAPVMVDAEAGLARWLNPREVGAVLGGPAFVGATGSERDELFAAAREERYYLIVSAYEVGPGGELPAERRLLWRTHASVPMLGLSQARAMPLLCAAAASLLGRETPAVQKVAIESAGTLILAQK